MDLLSSRPLREGSRGGRSEFSWETVKTDKDRENYLGHSLMAPVGRWQQGRDLAWYAKGDQSGTADSERARRAEELRKVKEAEEDLLAKALGLPVKPRTRETEEKALSGEEIRRAVGIVTTTDDDKEQGKGVGYGRAGFWGVTSGEQWDKVDADQGSQRPGENKPYTRPLLPGQSLPQDQQQGRYEQEPRRNQKHHRGGPPPREPEKPRTRRDRSRSRERNKPRSTTTSYEEEKCNPRRHHHERSASPMRRKRLRSRSQSRDRHRVRGEDRRRNAYSGDRERSNRPEWASRRGERSRDRGYGRGR